MISNKNFCEIGDSYEIFQHWYFKYIVMIPLYTNVDVLYAHVGRNERIVSYLIHLVLDIDKVYAGDQQ